MNEMVTYVFPRVLFPAPVSPMIMIRGKGIIPVGEPKPLIEHAAEHGGGGAEPRASSAAARSELLSMAIQRHESLAGQQLLV